MTTQKGIFVVIEGVDGIGKSTQCRMLADRYPNSYLLSSPDRTLHTGKLINQYLKKEITLSPKTAQLLFAANRQEQQAIIRAKLDEGKMVICDRYIYSAFAYGVAIGLKPNWCKKIDDGLIEPDIVFYLWATDKFIENRIGDDERYDDKNIQLAVSKNFDYQISNNWLMICGHTGDANLIHEKIVSILDR